MPPFSGLAQVEDQEDGVHAKLLAPLSYTHKGWKITVPKGFTTNFASIPRVFWRLLPPRGRYNRAAIVHDWLYFAQPIDPLTKKPIKQSRADLILRDAALDLEAKWWEALALWVGVRIGGWVAWNNHRKREIEG